jgi:hypothetical protein
MKRFQEYFAPPPHQQPPPPSHKAKPTSALVALGRQTHHTLNSSFLCSLQIVQPISCLSSLQPINI